jgi:hypothetical protein
MDRSELLRLARVGAAARLQELRAEMVAIVRQFPALRRGSVASQRDGSKRPRRRRRMSAEARRRISEAQKARWAKQKAQGAGGKKK